MCLMGIFWEFYNCTWNIEIWKSGIHFEWTHILFQITCLQCLKLQILVEQVEGLLNQTILFTTSSPFKNPMYAHALYCSPALLNCSLCIFQGTKSRYLIFLYKVDYLTLYRITVAKYDLRYFRLWDCEQSNCWTKIYCIVKGMPVVY